MELLVDFDHYRNTATERFSVRMSVSIGIEHPSDLIADSAGFKRGIANKQHRSSRGTNCNKKLEMMNFRLLQIEMARPIAIVTLS